LGFCCCLHFIPAFFSTIYIIQTQVTNIGYNYVTYYKLLVLTLLPAIVFTLRAIRKNEVLLIDSQGIYHNSLFVTSWANFVSATYIQGGGDSVMLVITCYKKPGTQHTKKILLAGSRNKSEEEVTAAINYFDNILKTGGE